MWTHEGRISTFTQSENYHTVFKDNHKYSEWDIDFLSMFAFDDEQNVGIVIFWWNYNYKSCLILCKRLLTWRRNQSSTGIKKTQRLSQTWSPILDQASANCRLKRYAQTAEDCGAKENKFDKEKCNNYLVYQNNNCCVNM